MANDNSTPEWETFAHSAQLARQGLTQAQMALAFLGDDERANRLTIQLQGVAELVSAMQSGHSALVVEHEELEELIDGNATRRPYHGLIVGPIVEEEHANSTWSKRLVVLWLRFRGLAPIGVAIFVVIAAAAGVMGRSPGPASPSLVRTSGSSVDITYLGDTISVGSLRCTLLRITVDPIQWSNIHRPPDTEYMTAHIQLYNTGSGYAHVDPTDFHLTAGAGTNVSEDAAIVTTLSAGALAPGESLAADLVFNVQRGNGVIELTWSPRPGVDMHQHAWLLEL